MPIYSLKLNNKCNICISFIRRTYIYAIYSISVSYQNLTFFCTLDFIGNSDVLFGSVHEKLKYFSSITRTRAAENCSCRQLQRKYFWSSSFVTMALPQHDEIIFFIPNLIGYGRIVLALIAFWFMASNYLVSGWCYIISALLDAVDGHAARAFDQSTRFGAMLDQLTDRCGTMGLLVTLSYFYPKYMFWFQLSMAIDIACHWLYMQTSVLVGRSSHKVSDNFIMRVYYQKDVLTFMCCVNELFYICLYLLHFTNGPLILGISLFKALAVISSPFAVLKSLISCTHAYVASQDLIAVDVRERQERRQKEACKKAE